MSEQKDPYEGKTAEEIFKMLMENPVSKPTEPIPTFKELTSFTTETFLNLRADEIYDLLKMYYYFKLTQTISGRAIGLTHYQMSCGAMLLKVLKKTPTKQMDLLIKDSSQLRDFIAHEAITVMEFIKDSGSQADIEEYL